MNKQNTYSRPVYKTGGWDERCPTDILILLIWSIFLLLCKALYLYTGISFIHIIHLYNRNDSKVNWTPAVVERIL